jgi:hypothetical protein
MTKGTQNHINFLPDTLHMDSLSAQLHDSIENNKNEDCRNLRWMCVCVCE